MHSFYKALSWGRRYPRKSIVVSFLFDPAINRRFFETSFVSLIKSILFILKSSVVSFLLAQQLIGTTAPSPAQQLLILANALLWLLVVEIEKRIGKGFFGEKKKRSGVYQND